VSADRRARAGATNDPIDAVRDLPYAAPILPTQAKNKKMAYPETPPRPIATRVSSPLSDHITRRGGTYALGDVFVFAPSGESIARIKSCRGTARIKVATGGQNRDRLSIMETATGTVLVADIGSLNASLRGA
jgi:hypothetical protein